ncbi:MAG TPA: 2'-deoxycytidine 5'-triphosphate deaminase [Nitrospiraceae bacterium]|nr:2'-deoxycytidine 5'-triphosphate deaminase [Nitrospiraceae bacterium]
MTDQLHSLFPELERDLRSLSFSTGIFPSQKIHELIEDGRISSSWPIEEDQIQPSSIDLRLGPIAYRMRASFLPGPNGIIENKLRNLVMSEVDLTRPTVFERGSVYLVPLMEFLALPPQTSAKANPKSTTGRLDIFTRLICDGATEFERVPEGYKGMLYAEVVPRTFTIIVRQGVKLNQLRFVRGCPSPTESMHRKLDANEGLVYDEEDARRNADIDRGIMVSLNLEGTKEDNIIGYRGKHNAPAIDLLKVNYYEPEEFWEPIPAPHSKRIILNPDDFYLLLSKRKVSVPPGSAAEMVAYDPSMGEFRIHYAGFFDPGFGYGARDVKGSYAVLEVRSHEVPFLIEDGQIVGRLIYERMLAAPDKIYGMGIGSSYQGQGLALSKQFKRFRHTATL